MTTSKLPFRPLLAAAALLLLAGCDTVVLNPSGDIAAQQGKLVISSTLLMLLIIVPVILLTVLFAWRYRAANTKATYAPDWDHSTQLELVIWAAPLAIIIALGAITWITTHTLDPYRPLDRIAEGRPVPADVKPLEIQVVAMDWKWLFIYPEQGIATLNEVAAPVDRPVRFKITATSVMNAFYIPHLAGMIYAMPAMETQLNAVINKPGNYEGFSANYSGAGFSDMKFRFHGLDDAGFAAWVKKHKDGGTALTRADYLKLEAPSVKEPVRYYASVEPTLYHDILNGCAAPGKPCMDQLMAMDMGMAPRPAHGEGAAAGHAGPQASAAPAAAGPEGHGQGHDGHAAAPAAGHAGH
ncbi:MAG TPA: ubiquinol oxidase subunit II [Moraxellaceae bacterium]|nr:ubiquinol oxidase subunit II [Moraxellaceae bacterium]